MLMKKLRYYHTHPYGIVNHRCENCNVGSGMELTIKECDHLGWRVGVTNPFHYVLCPNCVGKFMLERSSEGGKQCIM